MKNPVTEAPELSEIRRILDDAQANGEADHYTGKRKWTRFRSGMAGEVSTDPEDASAAWFVNLQNISGGGFACWSKRRVSQHSRIFLREFRPDRPPIWIPAVVSHCTSGIRGFLLGASFEMTLPAEPTK